MPPVKLRVFIFCVTMLATASRVTMPEDGLSKPVSTWSNMERASSLAVTTSTEPSSSGCGLEAGSRGRTK